MEPVLQAFPIIFEETPQSSQNVPSEAKQSDSQDTDANAKTSCTLDTTDKKTKVKTNKGDTEAESGSPTKKQINDQSNTITESTDILSQSFDMDSIVCSKDAHEAALGVSRIWVHTDERRKGIATRLIDAARYSYY